MMPCELKWSECYAPPSQQGNDPKDVKYRLWGTNNHQWLQWDDVPEFPPGKCGSKKRICVAGSCQILDIMNDGVNAVDRLFGEVNRRRKTLYVDTCIRLVLVTSCPRPVQGSEQKEPCNGVPVKRKLYKVSWSYEYPNNCKVPGCKVRKEVDVKIPGIQEQGATCSVHIPFGPIVACKD